MKRKKRETLYGRRCEICSAIVDAIVMRFRNKIGTDREGYYWETGDRVWNPFNYDAGTWLGDLQTCKEGGRWKIEGRRCYGEQKKRARGNAIIFSAWKNVSQGGSKSFTLVAIDNVEISLHRYYDCWNCARQRVIKLKTGWYSSRIQRARWSGFVRKRNTLPEFILRSVLWNFPFDQILLLFQF